MTDVLIAGGGIAGSALAIMLGRLGLSVELYERGNFPKEKPCGEGLMPGGIAVLQRLRLAQQVGGFPFFGLRYHVEGRVVQGRFPKLDGYPAFGRGQRRKILDETLFGAATETPGVFARAGAQVTSLLWANGRVAGALVDDEERRAGLVVGADGARSRLRQLAGLELQAGRKRFGVRAHFRLAPGQEELPWVEIFLGQGHELYVTPLPRREILVAGLANAQSLKNFQETGAATAIEQVFQGWWQAQPALAKRLEGAQQVSPLLTISPLEGHARAGVAPGMVLLGDAAGFADPITGGGMTQALITGELLAQTIALGLAENRNWLAEDSWLARFDRKRQAMLRGYRIVTRVALWLAQRPRFAADAISALGAWPGFFSHLLGVTSGTRKLSGGTVRVPARIPAIAAGRLMAPRKNGAAAWIPEIGGHGSPLGGREHAGG